MADTETNGKKKPEEIKVKLSDGREATFVGKRNINKDFKVNKDGSVTATFDFRTGDTLSLTIEPNDPMMAQLAGHGLIQKGGDEAAGVKDAAGNPDVPSMVLAVESVLKRLADKSKEMKDRWFAEAAAGDGFSGAGVVVRALMEVTGKDAEFVKGYLERKLEAGAKDGLTRQKMYQAFRRSGKVAEVIARMEKEKAEKETPAIDADAALAELSA